MIRPRTTCATLALLAAATAPCQDPVFPDASWPTATPASQNLDGTLLTRAVDALPFPGNVGPLVIIANGHLVFTRGTPSATSDLFSCSKVVTGMVAAKLIQAGTLTSLDALVPNSVPGPWGTNYPGDSSVGDFLTMTSDYGLSPYKPAGAQYAYNNNGIHFLGEYLGRGLLGLPAGSMHTAVSQELFSTLRHEDPITFNGQWGGWSGGLRLSARDMARLGYLLLRGGQWKGQRILDERFVDGLFRSQIPASASRYPGAVPGEDTQWNQQVFTDILAGNWSYGLWKVGSPRADGSFACVAAEGFRGKRMVLMPRGTLPDPLLEVVLVALPQFPTTDPGPASSVYRDLVANAVIPPTPHPDEDPRCGIATFDDGTLAPLDPAQGAPFVVSGEVVLDGAQRLVHRSAEVVDGNAVLRIRNGLTAGSRIGITVRAENPLDDWDAGNGTSTTFWLQQDASLGARVEVVSPNGPGALAQSAWMSGITPGTPVTFHVQFGARFAGCRVNDANVILFGGVNNLPTPALGGYLSVRSDVQGAQAAALDYVMFRPADGPTAQVQNTLNGHVLGLLGWREVSGLDFNSWFVDTAGFPVDIYLFGVAQPFMWPNILGFDTDHLMLSSDGALAGIPSGVEVRFRYRGRAEGVFTR